MDRRAFRRHRNRGPRARPFPAGAAARAGAAGRHRHAVLRQHRLCQHHRARSRGALSRQPRDRGAPARLHALERDGDGGQGQPAASGRRRRSGRPHQLVRLAGHHARRRLQPLLARRERRPRRRLPLYPGPQLARHLCPCLPGRAPDRGAAAELPPGSGRQGPVELSAPQADARVLAVPHGVHGPGPADGDLPGALPEVPARPRHRQHREPQGLGVLRRRRDGRGGKPGRHRRGGAREARQPDLRRQLQPAAPGRPGARQRQDHPGARRRVPRRRLERDQADLGQLLGPAAGARQGRHPAQDHDGHAGRRLPGDEGQRRRLRAQALLRPPPQGAGDGRQDERRGHLAAAARRPRSAEGLRGLPPGGQPPRASPRCC